MAFTTIAKYWIIFSSQHTKQRFSLITSEANKILALYPSPNLIERIISRFELIAIDLTFPIK